MSLGGYLARRLGLGLAQILGVATLIFLLTEALPGDAAVVMAGDTPDPERIEQLRAAMQLDQPVWQRYVEWLGALLRADLGRSLVSDRPVVDTMIIALTPTLILAGVTFVLLVPIALVLGVLAAQRPGSLTDRVISGLTLSFYSVPEFASAVLLIAVFTLQLGVLPANALGVSRLPDQPTVLVLPVLVLLIRPLCSVSRLIRAGLIDADRSAFVRHLRRFPISERRIRWAHALPTAGPAAVQQLARTADWLLGGVIVVEAIFVIPGLGSTLVEAVGSRDVPVIQGLAVMFGAVTVLINILADLACFGLNPRAAEL